VKMQVQAADFFFQNSVVGTTDVVDKYFRLSQSRNQALRY
jgi:hypothetical protein